MNSASLGGGRCADAPTGALPSSAGSTGAPPSPAGPAAAANNLGSPNHHGSNRLSPPSYISCPSASSRHGLNIAHVNVNSVTAAGRLDELEQFTDLNNIHVLCISETKLDETVNPSLYILTSFGPPFTRHRTLHCGGVAIYIRKKLASTRIIQLELEGVEWVWVKV